MNQKDNELLCDAWMKQTNEAEGVIQDCVKRSQDHAYQLGLERGKQNINKTLLVIEQTIKAIDDQMAGNGNPIEQIEGIKAAYEQLEALHKELSC